MKKIIFVLTFLLFNLQSFGQEVLIKDVRVLSSITKLGDTVNIEIIFNSPIQEKQKIHIYFKRQDDKSILFSKVDEIVINEKAKIISVDIPQNLNINAFYPEEAVSVEITVRLDEKEEILAGTIGLYRNWNLFRDGIVFPHFHIPFYVLLMSFLGTIGYVCISIYKRPEWSFKNILKWIERIILGILLGIFLYSSYSFLGLEQDPYLVGALAFATGFYISPILYRMREFVYSKLAPDKKIQDDIIDIEKEDIEIIKELHVSNRVAYFLSKYGVIKIEDLASISEDLIKEVAKKYKIDENYLKEIKQLAKEYIEKCEKEIKCKTKEEEQDDKE